MHPRHHSVYIVLYFTILFVFSASFFYYYYFFNWHCATSVPIITWSSSTGTLTVVQVNVSIYFYVPCVNLNVEFVASAQMRIEETQHYKFICLHYFVDPSIRLELLLLLLPLLLLIPLLPVKIYQRYIAMMVLTLKPTIMVTCTLFTCEVLAWNCFILFHDTQHYDKVWWSKKF